LTDTTSSSIDYTPLQTTAKTLEAVSATGQTTIMSTGT